MGACLRSAAFRTVGDDGGTGALHYPSDPITAAADA